MPVTIACPKCQTKYQLPDRALGKPVKCKSCDAVFRTPADNSTRPASSQKSQSSKPEPSAQDLAEFGIDGPLKRQADVFAGTAPLPPQQANPLGNFVIEDPGFADIGNARNEVYGEEDVDEDGMGAILTNPFASSKDQSKTKAKKNWGEGDPNYSYQSLTLWAILTSVGLVFEALFWVVVPLVFWGMISSLPDDPDAVDAEGAIGTLMALGFVVLFIFLAWILNNVLTSIVLFIYLFKANCNVRALGAKGLKTTPAMCIVWWFVPIMNTFKPVQAISEICKATIRPRGKSWEKLPVPSNFNNGWALHAMGWLPLAVLIFVEIESPWIVMLLYALGAILHLAGAILLVKVLFEVANQQNEHALDKYGKI